MIFGRKSENGIKVNCMELPR
jgi:hypothetical protein